MTSAGIFGVNQSFHVLSTKQGTLRDIKQDGINFQLMSDTLIAWVNDSKIESLILLSQFAATYLATTVMLGLPHRGAISKGHIQLVDLPLNGKMQSNAIGSGVVNAHHFEGGQEWMGCAVDPMCLDHLSQSEVQALLKLQYCPIVEYDIPYKCGSKCTSNLAVDWPRCLKEFISPADPNYFRTQFGRHGKAPIPSVDVETKIQNTHHFFAAMTTSNS